MQPLIEVDNLKTYFFLNEGILKAVDGVSFSLKKGEVLGIVGESGCGKTVTALSILRLVSPPGQIVQGKVLFKGTDLITLKEEEMRKIRGNRIAMIFQDPMTFLNPSFNIVNQVSEVILLHQNVSKKEAFEKGVNLLEKVGIPRARERAFNYPHQLSGGMRQRVMIAMALSCQPDLLLADEPTTALDVTIQAQILDLIKEIQKETHSSLILITHNLGLVAGVSSNYVMVMYAGRTVEYGRIEQIFYHSAHPYTFSLLKAFPHLDQGSKVKFKPIKGLPPNLINLPEGCSFNPRCEWARKKCLKLAPKLVEIFPEHLVACHFPLLRSRPSSRS